MRIHHYYPQRRNIGDTFVRDGIRALIRRVESNVEFEDFVVNPPKGSDRPYGLRGENLRRSNAQADLVVVGGSNLYQCGSQGQWGVTTDVESLSALTRPLLMIGLGWGSSFRAKSHAPSPRSVEEIQLANRRAIASAVRDEPTAEFLRGLGVQDAQMTGCPATFLFDEPFRFRQSDLVAVTMPPGRFDKHPFFYWKLMRTLRGYLAWLDKTGCKPVLVCHDPRDFEHARALSRSRYEIMAATEPPPFYELFSRCCLVVGFRLHAAIMALSQGVPFLPVSFDLRGVGFTRTFDLADWTIDVAASGLGDALRQRTESVLAANIAPFAPALKRHQALQQKMQHFVESAIGRVQSSEA